MDPHFVSCWNPPTEDDLLDRCESQSEGILCHGEEPTHQRPETLGLKARHNSGSSGSLVLLVDSNGCRDLQLVAWPFRLKNEAEMKRHSRGSRIRGVKACPEKAALIKTLLIRLAAGIRMIASTASKFLSTNQPKRQKRTYRLDEPWGGVER